MERFLSVFFIVGCVVASCSQTIVLQTENVAETPFALTDRRAEDSGERQERASRFEEGSDAEKLAPEEGDRQESSREEPTGAFLESRTERLVQEKKQEQTPVDGRGKPRILWARSAGGTGWKEAYGIAVDSSDRIYITGAFAGQAKFGATTLQSRGDYDIFVACLDLKGRFLWAVSAGGKGRDEAYRIAVSGVGTQLIYIVGTFRGSAKFGRFSLTSARTAGFVALIGDGGGFAWVHALTSSSTLFAKGLAVDRTGQSYITGIFQGKAKIGTSTLDSVKSRGIFAAKLDIKGRFLWAVSPASGAFFESISSTYKIAVDRTGNSFITGTFAPEARFGIRTFKVKGHGLFVARLDAKGKFLGVSIGEGRGWQAYSQGVAVDDAGNTLITGTVGEQAQFGPHAIKKANTSAFVARLDAKGKFLWVRTGGGSSSNYSRDITTDRMGNTYITGYFAGLSRYGTTSLGAQGGFDVFIAKLDPKGRFAWAISGGGAAYEAGHAIHVGPQGNVYTAGAFEGRARFGSTELKAQGKRDIFVLKIAP